MARPTIPRESLKPSAPGSSWHALRGGAGSPLSVSPQTAISAETPGTLEQPAPKRSTLALLLWSEWFSHRNLLLFFLLAWLALFWAVPLVAHPLWLLAFAVIYALVAGPALGGSDVINGCEEFMLAFPPTRRERFRSRLLLGMVGLGLFTAMDVAVLGLNLSDVLARLFLSTGLIEPLQINQPELLYMLVAAFPAAVFAFSFSIAALARTRTVAFTSWLWGSLFALGALRLGLELEEWRWDHFNGRFSTPILIAAILSVLILSDRLYGWKEAGAEAPPLRIPLSWWGWMAAVVLAALGVTALLMWFATNFGRLL